MSRAPSFAGVILAAGESSRMGRDKALLPWPPGSENSSSAGTFLSSAIRSLSAATDFVVIVAGHNEGSLAPVAYANGAFVVVNPDPARGQFSSLQTGLCEVLNRGRDAALITLVDRPPAAITTVQTLRQAYESAEQSIWAVIPEYAQKHGHPYAAGREMIERFLRQPATDNAREIEHRYQDHIRYLPVSDPFVVLNINTPEEYAALVAQS